MYFKNKNVTARQDKMFIWEKKRPTNRNPGFMKVEYQLSGRIYFHINKF